MPAFKCMPYGDSLVTAVAIVYLKMVCLHDMIAFELHIAFICNVLSDPIAHTLRTHENVGITSSDDGGQ